MRTTGQSDALLVQGKTTTTTYPPDLSPALVLTGAPCLHAGPPSGGRTRGCAPSSEPGVRGLGQGCGAATTQVVPQGV